jgi:hypothetical protein
MVMKNNNYKNENLKLDIKSQIDMKWNNQIKIMIDDYIKLLKILNKSRLILNNFDKQMNMEDNDDIEMDMCNIPLREQLLNNVYCDEDNVHCIICKIKKMYIQKYGWYTIENIEKSQNIKFNII